MEIPDPTPVILLVLTGDAENPSFLLLLLKISLPTFCLLMSVAGCRLKSPVWLESHRLQPFYTLPGLCACVRAWALRMQGIPGEKWALVA